MSEATKQSEALIQSTLDRCRKAFQTRRTFPVSWRKQQLNQLRKGMTEMRSELQEALEKDLGRSKFLTEFIDLEVCDIDLNYSLANIDQFTKDISVDSSLVIAPCKSSVRYEPLGVVLVMGSWNYPYLVNIKPLIQAITSGNCCVVKPSEMAPESSSLIKKLVDKYLDNDCFQVIEGGVEIASIICNFKWDLICFTGSTMKGKLVAQAAAKNLIPCILELGGKCPVVVDIGCNVDFAAAKIAFARFNNSGQTCLAVDYVLVHESLKSQLIERIKVKTNQMYGEGKIDGSPDMGKMVNEWHCDRVDQLIKSSGGKIVFGGKVFKEKKYIEPTIIDGPKLDSPIMDEEIFAPVLPVLTFKKIDECIELINNKDKPLAVYYFGPVMSNPNRDRLKDETSSGAFLQNEVLYHIVNHSFGFGGVGASGYGRYGGYEGFKQWSNPKGVMIKPPLNIYPFTQLFPPFPENKKKLIQFLVGVEGSQWGVIKIVLALLVVIFGYMLLGGCCLGGSSDHHDHHHN